MFYFLTIIKRLIPCWVFSSCAQTGKPSDPIVVIERTIEFETFDLGAMVDYKKDSYRISLGDDYRLSDKTIHWFWAAMNDKDGMLDSNGFDAFKSVGEPALEFENEKLLPTLDILCYKNKVIEFQCSILFTDGNSHKSEMNFLRLISSDFRKLRIDSIQNSIINRGGYEIITKNYSESYRLTKRNEHGYNKFEYKVKLRENGR